MVLQCKLARLGLKQGWHVFIGQLVKGLLKHCTEVDDGIKVGAFASFFYETDSSYFDNGKDDSWWITPNE